MKAKVSIFIIGVQYTTFENDFGKHFILFESIVFEKLHNLIY